jgi:Family of unknown function (DUF6516)
MRARLLYRFRREISERARIEGVIWEVPKAVLGSEHGFKYRLALIVDGTCVLRYDNERGKGDHRHIDGREEPYTFTSAESLVREFLADVEKVMK